MLNNRILFFLLSLYDTLSVVASVDGLAYDVCYHHANERIVLYG
mgnify:CR=1 FL=1|jgi:hypothetical protein